MTISQPWLASYEPGVPHQINPGEYSSLVDLLDQSFKQFAKRDMAAFMDVHWTFEQVDDLSRALAGYFQSIGLAKGARIALMMPNVPQYVVAIAAVLRAGYVVVNVNPLYTPRELEHQLKDSGSEAIVILENFATTLQEVLPRTPIKSVILASMGDMLPFPKSLLVNFVVRHVKKMVPAFSLPTDKAKVLTFKDALAKGRSVKYTRPSLKASDVAFLQYTGGTTGVSKGATLLHSNVVANILQNEAWFKPELAKLGNEPLVAVCALPLYHIFSLTVCYFMGARMGSMNILIPNPRDLPGVIKTLKNYRVNQFPAVNTLFNALANHPDFAQLDFSGLKVSMGGGMAVQQATAEKWKKVTGCAIVEGYGLSETSPVATANRLDNTEFNGSIGFPLPSTEIAIMDDDGKHLEIGGVGEIAIRGPQVMAGYWQRDDETAKVMTADNFFRTGDIGVMDASGQVKIVDRKKDMILVSGFNVYPNEVEQVVNLHPGVMECAAVGVPDDKSGEAVKLFVVRKDSTLTEAQLKAYCHEQLTGYKCPKHIEFRNDLPKTNVGKILRRELRDEKKAA
ncbi:long-chain acyl-CoA synthetase [Aquabacterium commune]|jgi:long-chain acyl-CoA synthetase|uniref:Long-chain-fatty-acid--CoA ligase n=1 Tax=Aquabacterium commune TaxID=70586 RepID=A0A4R6RQ97_9BURK|nr:MULTISPECIES: long-chain-fatty-acid--CoA ligase [Aquabacterium]TDP88415.1 long-chain acyl-CoA synthetase [Aquabacterium commune]|tara:strand:- start:584 stop:2281 length:1698 start_codon:yes stop_codon:yes gene_type:complete